MTNGINSLDAGVSLSTDAKIFLGTVACGFFLLLIMKSLGIPQLIITLTISSLVVVYSVMVVKLGRMHLRLDQAGDNAYYLGLIFTLLAMGRALYEIGKMAQEHAQDTQTQDLFVAEIIIGDFGLALGSTLVGIICRIILHQMRVDPADIEAESRLKLAQAANIMIVQLNDLSSSFGAFVVTLQQKQIDYTNEMIEHNQTICNSFESNMKQALSRAVSGIEDVIVILTNSVNKLASVVSSNTQELNEACVRLREIQGPARLNQSFNKMSGKIENIADNISAANNNLAESVDQLQSSISKIDLITKEASQIPQAANRRIEEQQALFTESLLQISTTLVNLNDTVKLLESSATKLEANAGRSIEAVADAEKAAVEVLDRLTVVVKKVDNAISVGPTNP